MLKANPACQLIITGDEFRVRHAVNEGQILKDSVLRMVSWLKEVVATIWGRARA